MERLFILYIAKLYSEVKKMGLLSLIGAAVVIIVIIMILMWIF